MLRAVILSQAVVRIAEPLAKPSAILVVTGRTAAGVAVVAARAVGRARCSRRPARAAAKRPKCHSSPVATSPCTAHRASNSVVEAAEVALAAAATAADEDATKPYAR